MSEQLPQGKSALGVTFLTLGVALTVTFGIVFGPAFIGIGLPFAVLGFIFMSKAGDAQKGEQEGTQDK